MEDQLIFNAVKEHSRSSSQCMPRSHTAFYSGRGRPRFVFEYIFVKLYGPNWFASAAESRWAQRRGDFLGRTCKLFRIKLPAKTRKSRAQFVSKASRIVSPPNLVVCVG